MEKVFNLFANGDYEQISGENLEKIYLEQLNEQERKRLGQVFTPKYIIRFMIHQINLLTELKNIESSFNLKILDPACGLGRFLLETYDFLKKKMRESDWEQQNIHRTLLTRVLFGVDIEPLAVQFTAFTLYLKKNTTPVDGLFVMQSNILETEEPDQKLLKPLNVWEFITKSPKKTREITNRKIPSNYFDVVIGNPPYFLISQEERSALRGKQFHTTFHPMNLIKKYQTNYKSWPKENQDPNIFYLFIERGVQLLRNQGYLAFIVPDILISGNTTENLRKVILETCCIKKLILIDGQVFEEKGISNIIIVLQRCNEKKIRAENKVEVISTSTLELIETDKQKNYERFDEHPRFIPQAIFQETPQRNFAIRMTEENIAVFQNVFKKLQIGKLIKFKDVVEIQRGIENLKKSAALDSYRNGKQTIRKLIAGSNIENYRINWDAPLFPHKFIDYAPQNADYKHIHFKTKEWFVQPKIVLKRVSNKLVAALDVESENKLDYFFTMDSVQMLWLKTNAKNKYDLRLILAILNSEFMNFYYQTLFSYKKLFSRVQKAFLLELPIPPEIPQDKQKEISDLVDNLMKGVNPKSEESLDQLIYNLYFTPEELSRFHGLFQTPLTLKDLPGIGIAKYWELKKAGIKSLRDLLGCNSEELASSFKGIGKKSIEKWKAEAKKIVKKERN
ncbi:MAG: N-6 DNA methylase [Candidatus Helarchaeota archaeon]|nr:N-6 DNA methylase [Candidatus Helarchaeota archaeon]